MLIDLENVKAEKSPGEEENGEEVFYNVESTEKMTEYEKESFILYSKVLYKVQGFARSAQPSLYGLSCHRNLVK